MTVALNKQETALLDWLLSAPKGPRLRGFVIVHRNGRATVKLKPKGDVRKLLDLVCTIRPWQLPMLGWTPRNYNTLNDKLEQLEKQPS